MIEEIKNLRKKGNDPLSFEKWIVTVNQIVMTALTCNMEKNICVVNLCFLNFVEYGLVILSNVTFGQL